MHNGLARQLFQEVAEGKSDPYSVAARLLADPPLLRQLLGLAPEEKS